MSSMKVSGGSGDVNAASFKLGAAGIPKPEDVKNWQDAEAYAQQYTERGDVNNAIAYYNRAYNLLNDSGSKTNAAQLCLRAGLALHPLNESVGDEWYSLALATDPSIKSDLIAQVHPTDAKLGLYFYNAINRLGADNFPTNSIDDAMKYLKKYYDATTDQAFKNGFSDLINKLSTRVTYDTLSQESKIIYVDNMTDNGDKAGKYEGLGRWEKAGDVWKALGQHDKAATDYEKAYGAASGDDVARLKRLAMEEFKAAGDAGRSDKDAAENYDKACNLAIGLSDWATAGACGEKAGDIWRDKQLTTSAIASYSKAYDGYVHANIGKKYDITMKVVPLLISQKSSGTNTTDWLSGWPAGGQTVDTLKADLRACRNRGTDLEMAKAVVMVAIVDHTGWGAIEILKSTTSSAVKDFLTSYVVKSFRAIYGESWNNTYANWKSCGVDVWPGAWPKILGYPDGQEIASGQTSFSADSLKTV